MSPRSESHYHWQPWIELFSTSYYNRGLSRESGGDLMESKFVGVCVMQRVPPFSRESRASVNPPRFPIDPVARRIDVTEEGNGGSGKARVLEPNIAAGHEREHLGHKLVASCSPTSDRTSGSALLSQFWLDVSASHDVRAQSRLTR